MESAGTAAQAGFGETGKINSDGCAGSCRWHLCKSILGSRHLLNCISLPALPAATYAQSSRKSFPYVRAAVWPRPSLLGMPHQRHLADEIRV